jgi:hypothetical protein
MPAHIRVRHFRPGTSKWNEIEYRLFSIINQRAKPLISREVIRSVLIVVR